MEHISVFSLSYTVIENKQYCAVQFFIVSYNTQTFLNVFCSKHEEMWKYKGAMAGFD